MLSTGTIILEYVCPALGAITANLMFLAPVRDVQRAILRGSLGDLNPTPWALMLGNCCGWIIYSFLIQNLFMFFANVNGFLLSTWFNLAASKLLYRQQFVPVLLQDSGHEDGILSEANTISTTDNHTPGNKQNGKHENLQYTTPNHDWLVIAMIVFWTALVSLLALGKGLSNSTQQSIVGIVVNLNLVFFYGAPLTTIVTVLKTSDAASLHVPTMLTNTANGIFWAAYGIAVMDYYVLVPNAIGTILGGVQIVLYVIFPRSKSAELPSQNSTDES